MVAAAFLTNIIIMGDTHKTTTRIPIPTASFLAASLNCSSTYSLKDLQRVFIIFGYIVSS